MRQQSLTASFMRGGTSKAVMFRREDLPDDPTDWDAIFLDVMGSPDPNGRQLDGMGGGLSSLSKICVIGASSRSDADVDYTFAQVGVADSLVDYSGNCGNMSSAVGPFAVRNGLVPPPADGEASVRIYNTNTSRVIVSRFPVKAGLPVEDGDMTLDGVAGSAAPIRLEFVEPGGGKTGRLLPTGNIVDRMVLSDGTAVEATLVDAANPCVFVDAASLGKSGTERPEALEADPAFLATLESVRRAAVVAMGLASDLEAAARIQAVPKIGIVAAPASYRTLSGSEVAARDVDLLVRMISVGQPHRAIPLTAAVCNAVAVRLPGSIPNRAATIGEAPIRIGHPSGVITVDAKVTVGGDSPEDAHAEYGAVYRTARLLFEGSIFRHARAA